MSTSHHKMGDPCEPDCHNTGRAKDIALNADPANGPTEDHGDLSGCKVLREGTADPTDKEVRYCIEATLENV